MIPLNQSKFYNSKLLFGFNFSSCKSINYDRKSHVSNLSLKPKITANILSS